MASIKTVVPAAHPTFLTAAPNPSSLIDAGGLSRVQHFTACPHFALEAPASACPASRRRTRRARPLTAKRRPSAVAVGVDMQSAVPPGASAFALPDARVYGGVTFPLPLTPAGEGSELGLKSLADWARSQRDAIERAVAAHGGLLLRGWTGPDGAQLTPADLASFVAALGRENFPYIGGNAVRREIPGTDNRVFTANESPPEQPIPFHHELAQTPDYPRAVAFFCELPSETGGETPIVLSTAVYDALRTAHPEFVDKLEKHGVVYSRVMSAHDRPESAIGRGWRATFKAKTPTDVEQILSKNGYSWEWRDPENPAMPAPPGTADPLLRESSPVLDAVKPVQASSGEAGKEKEGNGKKAFFNQLVAVWGGWRDEFNSPENCIRFGDGSLLDPVAMEAAQRIMQEHAVAIPWQKGDIMFLDNMQVQHSRNTFTGKRRVLASLTR